MSSEPSSFLCETSQQTFRQVRDWLNLQASQADSPLVVGIGGPGGSGKSTLTRWLLQNMRDISELALDDFRYSRKARRSSGRFGSHPEGNDLQLLEDSLDRIRAGGEIHQPVFNRQTGEVDRMETRPVGRMVLADGEIAAHHHLRSHLDRLILVDAHWRTQLNTRLTRDIQERNCTLEKAIHLFLESNLRDYPRYASDAQDHAEVILYRNTRHIFTVRKMG